MGDDAPPGFTDNVKSVEDFNLTCDTNAKHAREIANARRMAGAAGVCGVDHWDLIACALRGAVLARGNNASRESCKGCMSSATSATLSTATVSSSGTLTKLNCGTYMYMYILIPT